MNHTSLDLSRCEALKSVTLREDVARLVILIKSLRSIPDRSSVSHVTLVLYTPYPVFWLLDWMALRSALADRRKFPCMAMLDVRFYFYRDIDDGTRMREMVEQVRDDVAKGSFNSDVWSARRRGAHRVGRFV